MMSKFDIPMMSYIIVYNSKWQRYVQVMSGGHHGDVRKTSRCRMGDIQMMPGTSLKIAYDLSMRMSCDVK